MTVLMYNRPADFQGGEKSKGGDPWKSKIFLLKGVGERGCRGVRSLRKPSIFLIRKKSKISNLRDYNT